MEFAFDDDLDERIAGHVLNALVRLVHEFEQFVDHRFEELPMATQKARILANNIHAEIVQGNIISM
jgi:hypothetical protein